MSISEGLMLVGPRVRQFAFSLSSELLGACIRFMKQWRCIQARFLVNAARIHPSSPE